MLLVVARNPLGIYCFRGLVNHWAYSLGGFMIRNAVLGLVGAVALMSSANAADMYAPSGGGLKDGPVYDSWTGLYAGLHVGAAWADFSAVDVDGYNTAGSTTAFNPNGVFGGATFGKNFQRGQIVFGLEGDLGGMDLGITKPLATTSSGNTTATLDGGLYADVTGRLGYLVAPNVLAYTKGGFAVYNGSFQVDGNNTSNGVFGSSTPSNTFIGWTVGAGVEYALNSKWTAKAEYQYFDFGGQTVGGNNATQSLNAGDGYRFDAKDLTVNAVSVGLNYRLSPASEPLK